MKLRPDQTENSMQPLISKHEVVHPSEKTRADVYVHPWYEFLNRPNQPTTEAVEKAKFVDKSYVWKPK